MKDSHYKTQFIKHGLKINMGGSHSDGLSSTLELDKI